MKHFVVYSHGFGVKKDDRGLFTDIARVVPSAEHILFDYNEINQAGNTLSVTPLRQQASLLNQKLGALPQDAVVDIIAHSQGCVVTAMAKPKDVRQILCLAPPVNLSQERIVRMFGSRSGAVINLEGQSTIPRRDGSTTIIPKDYWASIEIDVIDLYNDFPNFSKTTFIIAKDDEVLGTSNFEQLDSRIELTQLDGDHDFTGDTRQNLTNAVKERLSTSIV